MPQRKRGRAQTAAPLTSGDVVAAALSLVDDAGVAGFTMRALATRLGTYPATLYWHVGNRNEILARVFDRVMDEMEVAPPDSMAWDAWLAALAREYRRVLHLHPNAAALALYPVVAAADTVEVVVAVLQHGGFTGPMLAHAFNAFTGSVTGWVSVELSAGGGETDQRWREDFADRVLSIDPETHPTIAAHMDDLADEVFTLRWHGGAEKPLDDSFEVALGVWIEGLRALRRRTHRTGS